jgi:hypothetical protein
MSEDRYWILEFSNEDNGIDAVSEVTGLPLVGLVDEETGGVIAYITADRASDICGTLNIVDAI